MATIPQAHVTAADALADWCSIAPETLGTIYNTVLMGTGATQWKVLTVLPENVSTGQPGGVRPLFRAATREALRHELLMRLALYITRTEVDVLGRAAAEADAIIQAVEVALQGAGRMQAFAQAGGLLGRETRLGLDALDRATALVLKGDKAIGTAFLVGRDLVLTSAHVAVDQSGNSFVQQLAANLTFHFPVFAGLVAKPSIVAKPKSGKSLLHSSLPWGDAPDRLHAPPTEGSDAKLDYALIRLDRQITHVDPLDILEPPELDKDEALVVLGFAGGTAVKWDKGVVASVTGERVQHKANTLAGMSGSCCIDVHGKPVGIHEGSLLDRKLGGNGDLNRAVRLSAIRNAMRSNGADPLLAAPKAPGFAIYDESLVRRTAYAGLRILPAEDHARWRHLVRGVLGAEPDSPDPLPEFHPWFRRKNFEAWVDNSVRELPLEAQRLFMASGDPGTGKSFLASILREKLLDALAETAYISATQTTAWSWTDALSKLGIAPSDERELRPHDAEVRRVTTEAAQAVAERASSRGSSRIPLFVIIDFEGDASFAAEDSPWLRFMQELLGHSWVRLVVIGAPPTIRAELDASASVEGIDRYGSIESTIDPVSPADFKQYVEKVLKQYRGNVAAADVARVVGLLDGVLAQFPSDALRSACTALVGIMLQRSMEG